METIFVAALKEETPKLSKFHHTGVGKINASIKLMELINVHKPTQVINYGTAGSFKKNISGLIECTTFVQHDMDARGLLDFKLGETPFDRISKIILSNEGYICATGDRFVKNKLEINCDIVDMEAYALAKICKLYEIEFKCFKYISDYANDESSNDWVENCHKGASEFLSIYPECK
jgi:adenosylhomocysteine nucleosidase